MSSLSLPLWSKLAELCFSRHTWVCIYVEQVVQVTCRVCRGNCGKAACSQTNRDTHSWCFSVVWCSRNVPAGVVSDIKACLSFLWRCKTISRPKPKLPKMKIPSTRVHGHLPVSAGCHCIWFEMHDCNSRCHRWVIPKAPPSYLQRCLQIMCLFMNHAFHLRPDPSGALWRPLWVINLNLNRGSKVLHQAARDWFPGDALCEKLALFFVYLLGFKLWSQGWTNMPISIYSQTDLTNRITDSQDQAIKLQLILPIRKGVHTRYQGSGWACWHRCCTVDVIITATFLMKSSEWCNKLRGASVAGQI